MNSTFNINRFWQLFKKEGFENFKRFATSIYVLWVVPISIVIVNKILRPEYITISDNRLMTILFFTSLLMLLTPSKLYGNYNNNKTGIYRALLPASNLEKFLSMLSYCIIITPLFYFAGAIIIDSILTIIPGTGYKSFLFSTPINLNYPQLFESRMDLSITILLITSSIMQIGIFLFFNMVFKKHKFSKTFLSIFAITLLLFITGMKIAENSDYVFMNMTPDETYHIMFKVMITLIIITSLIAIATFYGTYYKIRNQKY